MIYILNKKKLVLLWENPNPDDSFEAQKITYDAIGCKRFDVIFKNNVSSDLTNVVRGYIEQRCSFRGLDSGKIIVRNIGISGDTNSFLSETGCTFGSGIKINSYGQETTDNTVAIPIKIIGYYDSYE